MNIINNNNYNIYVPDNTVFLRDSNCIVAEYVGTQTITTIRMKLTIYDQNSQTYTISNTVYGKDITLNINNVLTKIYNLYHLTESDIVGVDTITVEVTAYKGLTQISDTANVNTALSGFETCSIIRDGLTLPNRYHYSERDIFFPPESVYESVHGTTDREIYTSTEGVIDVDGKAFTEGQLIPLSMDSDNCSEEISVDLQDTNYDAWKRSDYFWTYGVSQINPLSIKVDDDLYDWLINQTGFSFDPFCLKQYAHESNCWAFATAVFTPTTQEGIWQLSTIGQFAYLDYNVYNIGWVDLTPYKLYTTFNFLSYNYIKENFLFTFSCSILNESMTEIGKLYFQTSADTIMTGIRYTVNRIGTTDSFWGTPIDMNKRYYYYFTMESDNSYGLEMIGGLIGRYANSTYKSQLDTIPFFKFNKEVSLSSSLGGNVFITADGFWTVNTQENPDDNLNYSIMYQLFQSMAPYFYSVTFTCFSGSREGEEISIRVYFDKYHCNSISTYNNVSLIRCQSLTMRYNNIDIIGQIVEFLEIGVNKYRFCVVLEDEEGKYYDENGNQVGYIDENDHIVGSKFAMHIDYTGSDLFCDLICHQSNINNDDGKFTRDGVVLTKLNRISLNIIPIFQIFPFNCTNYAVLLKGTMFPNPQWCMMYRELTMSATSVVKIESEYSTYFNLGYDTEQDGVFYPATRQQGTFGQSGLSTYTFLVNGVEPYNISEVFNGASTVDFDYFVDYETYKTRYDCCIQHKKIYLDDEMGTPTKYNIITNQLCEGQNTVMWIRYQNTDGFERWLYGKVINKEFSTDNMKVGGIYPKENAIMQVPIYHTSGFAEKIKLAFCDIPKHCYIEDILQSPFIEIINYTGTTRYYAALEETSIVRNDEPYQDFVLTFVKKY
jgi:hypothetical protein